MLKKRILASSLASVMALSSVSVVAFADETATAEYGEVVTRAELKEELKKYEKLIESEITTYGSVQAVRFQEAYDHALYVANNVDEDAKVDDDNVTAAYQMLRVVYSKLQRYTNEQLKDLIEANKATYETNNILNPIIMDAIYEEDAWIEFKNAYQDAEDYVDIDDLMVVTDTYITLEEAAKNLAAHKITPVTKTEYRNMIQKYESMLKKFTKYEGWRRGKVTVNPKTGGAFDSDIFLTDAVYVTWKDLQTIVSGASNVNVVIEVNTGAAADDKTTLATDTWIAVDGTVEDYLYNQSLRFDGFKAAVKTTDTEIKAAYEAAKEAVAVFDSWKPIDPDSVIKTEANKTLRKYKHDLVVDFERELAASLAVNTGVAGLCWTDSDSNKHAALVYDKDAGTLIGQAGAEANNCELRLVTGTDLIQLNDSGAYDPADHNNDPTPIKSYTIKIKEGVDYIDYLPIRSTKIAKNDSADKSAYSTDAAGKIAKVNAALAMLETYNGVSGGDYTTAFGTAGTPVNDVADLDENKTVSKPSGGLKEYTFINRYLTYALQDLYPSQEAGCSHTRAQIEAKIEEAYDLINETGSSNIFATANDELAAARKAALEWVRESRKDRNYKDNDDDHGVFDFVDGDDGKAKADEVYHTLSCAAGGKFDALKALLEEYPISFAEVVAKITEVNTKFENGVYNDTVKAAVDDVAYCLSVLKASDEGNEAFNDERALNGYNRLRVSSASNSFEKALKTALDNLDKTIEESASAEVVKGDADGDGKVTINDALRALKASVGSVTLSESEKKAADVDGVPGVTALDALAILKMAL